MCEDQVCEDALVAVVPLSMSLVFTQGIKITNRVRLIVLPRKPGTNWTQSDVDFLLAILEEQALSLGQFQVFPRTDLDKLLRERQLVELGVSEA